MTCKITSAVQQYRMLVIAHRLRKFGFESQINDLSSDDLLYLAKLLYPHQRAAVEREVAQRQEAALMAAGKQA